MSSQQQGDGLQWWCHWSSWPRCSSDEAKGSTFVQLISTPSNSCCQTSGAACNTLNPAETLALSSPHCSDCALTTSLALNFSFESSFLSLCNPGTSDRSNQSCSTLWPHLLLVGRSRHGNHVLLLLLLLLLGGVLENLLVLQRTGGV